MAVYEGISGGLVIETDYYVSLEAIEHDKGLPECKRQYAIFEASVDLEKVSLAKYDGKNYLIKSTIMRVDGPIPHLRSGKDR